jgi:acyl-CoA synthetase (AMP-forming)/AMP-acid ligase II
VHHESIKTEAVGEIVNVATRLAAHARKRPGQIAVVEPRAGAAGRDIASRYRTISFAELDAESGRIAAGLAAIGVKPADRLALLVRPGIDFVTLVFALFKCGAVTILIDPGMGPRNLLRCLSEAEPDGFVALPMVHAIRLLARRRFPKARFLVTVGRRLGWGGLTLSQVRAAGMQQDLQVATQADDPAAIIFTTGSTGVPKGVLYQHGNFMEQVSQLKRHYGIKPGAVDLAGFPLFGLFNSGMGVTTVVPEMDATRPARVDPKKILSAVRDWRVTQSFGSPALWNRVARYCEARGVTIAHLKQVFSAGAPVPGRVLEMLKRHLPADAEIHTPYGATEALPVASITATEVLGETQQATDRGAGVCVGRRFSGIEWRVIPIVDGPLENLPAALPVGKIGELVVAGPVVSRQYVTQVSANRLGKIRDGETLWHRMGDLGYLDEAERFWFCGRMAQRVRCAETTLFTIPTEAIFNTHPAVFRTALVGLGAAGRQRPILIVEPYEKSYPRSKRERNLLREEFRALAAEHSLTRLIRDFLFCRSLPVDIRHNAKIFREKLVPWAARRMP